VADWLSVYDKARPGQKAYLLVGSPGVVVDNLVRAVSSDTDHLISLRPPVTEDTLSVLAGVGEEKQAIVIRSIEHTSPSDWEVIDRYLHAYKVPGQTLILAGNDVPDHEQARITKARIGRQGLYAHVSDPSGEVGRRNLVQWVAETFKIIAADAEYACTRASYRIEPLYWGQASFINLTGGRPMRGTKVRQILDLVIPLSETESIYRSFLARRRNDTAAAALSPGQARSLFSRLESALSDLSLLRPHLIGQISIKQLASKAGVHLFRTVELRPFIPSYPAEVILGCRRVLNLGFERWQQPEVVQTVSRLWGCR